MAYTNKTPNFDLPQYVASDKPTYLGDFNTAMSNIDTGMAENRTSAENATNIANNASTTATNAETTATAAQTTANQANTLAQTAKTAADTAQAGVDENKAQIANFNLTTFENLTVHTSNGTIESNTNVQLAKNSDGSLAKIYGEINIGNPTDNTPTVVTMQTSLRPAENITINGACLGRFQYNDGRFAPLPFSFTISTTGLITFSNINTIGVNNIRLWNIACLLFIKNFGDVPINPTV